MNSIVSVLMRRDGMSESEAREYARDVMASVRDAIGAGDFSGAEDIFTSEMGLEPDYLLAALI